MPYGVETQRFSGWEQDLSLRDALPFKAADRSAVIELWQACGLTRPWNDPDRDISRKLTVQPELFFIGEVDGKVVASAMAGYDGHRGSVFYLAVSPDYQRCGYAVDDVVCLGKRLIPDA